MSAVLDHLQAGQEDQAEAELTRILQSDPNNRLALSLMRQIKDDPVASLGRESFAYRVQPGESLSRIAQRFMNDLHLFYILARYNNIKVPRNLAGGQTIRVPGKAPAAGSQPSAPAPAPVAATPPPVPVQAAPVVSPASAAANAEAAAASRAARQRSEAVARHSRAARAAFAKQDLDAAIKSWDAVLEVDPENRTAQLERQKVLGLKEKLGKVK
jgi:tetratricopeptide (TPR) repeat protein